LALPILLYLRYHTSHYKILMKQTDQLSILYDGNCPLCCAQKEFLQRFDHMGKLNFHDIHSSNRPLLPPSIESESIQQEIHCILPDGQTLRGMEVIRTAYKQIGLGWLIAPTEWPVFRPIFDALYQLISRNRLKISVLYRQQKH
jgi:predicted DCC family thiol-disulfide oxidoreductase YuxK